MVVGGVVLLLGDTQNESFHPTVKVIETKSFS
jgi:hypothetical protein